MIQAFYLMAMIQCARDINVQEKAIKMKLFFFIERQLLI